MAEEVVQPAQVLPPPGNRLTAWEWARKNLFNNWWNSLLTVLALALIYAILRPALTWLFAEAQWEVVLVNLRLLMTGRYPVEQLWRAWLVLDILAAVVGLSWGVWVHRRWWVGLIGLAVIALMAALLPVSGEARLQITLLAVVAAAGFVVGRLGGNAVRKTVIAAWILYFPLTLLLITGVTAPGGVLPVVSTNLWGGLLLTFVLTVVGIVVSFPIGVLLALGRRSNMPLVRMLCVAYIEIIRGVPLITILFMASTMVPLFLPSGINIDRVLRAMIGIIMFSAAYLAENVRGGLQAIPRGQFEAAHALGLNGALTMGLVILPQALRLVIPVLVGQFISLFKDTTLVATIGLLDLLGIARSVLAQPQFIQYQHEVLVFITLVYWVFSFLLALISQRLERALGVGER